MKSKGIKLYNIAKKIIPSGTMLYSKKPELYLPDFWPTYFQNQKDAICGTYKERNILI